MNEKWLSIPGSHLYELIVQKYKKGTSLNVPFYISIE